jgi:hypothetical protein
MAVRKTQAVIVPGEGAGHPAFDKLSKKDAVQLLLGFERPIATPASQKRLVEQLHRWIDATDWRAAGGRAAFAPIELGPDCAAITFIGTTRPGQAVAALFSELGASPHGLREVVIARRRVGRSGKLGSVVGAALPKQKDYKKEDAWWRASFDETIAAPMTEDPAGMLSVVRHENGTMLMELRPAALAVPGVRIVYGLPDGVEYPKTNRRAVEVTKGVSGALAKAFGGRPPKLYNADAKAGRTFERISRDGRSGYVFAIAREDEMFAVYPSCFRYREYELMVGLSQAIETLRLQPVIHWLRDHCYMVNLWERRRR